MEVQQGRLWIKNQERGLLNIADAFCQVLLKPPSRPCRTCNWKALPKFASRASGLSNTNAVRWAPPVAGGWSLVTDLS